MVQYVWEAARRCRLLSEVIIATDDEGIAEIVRGFNGQVVLTPRDLPSGTDRAAWVARDRSESIVVNLQGDEPLIDPKAIDRLVQTLLDNPKSEMGTLVVRRDNEADRVNPNVVKAVLAESGRALYFSRTPIPHGASWFYKHIGIYAYRRAALERFCRLSPSFLEKQERLEQLRALENGFEIQTVVVDHDTIAVDTPEDLVKVEQHLTTIQSRAEHREFAYEE